MNISIGPLCGDVLVYPKMAKVSKKYAFLDKAFSKFLKILKKSCLFTGAYTTHQMVVRMALTSYDQIPEKLAEHCFIEYTMPATVVSHNTVRSISVQDSDSDDPPEKYVRYLSRYEYQ